MKIFIKLLYVVMIFFFLNSANAQLLERLKNFLSGSSCELSSDCPQGFSCRSKTGGGTECKKSTDANSELEKKASTENVDLNKQSKSESEPIKLYPTANESASEPVKLYSTANESASEPVKLNPTANENTFLGTVNVVKVIYFDYDSFTVKPEYRSTIEAHAQYLKSNGRAKLSIEGHTDKRFPSLEYGLTISQKRADAVRQYLTLSGVEASQIEVVSFGSVKPAVVGNDEVANAKNRRVEFFYNYPPEGVVMPQATQQQALKLKDCDECPEMVVIPAGGFVMGVSPSEAERENLPKEYRDRSQPQHRVEVRQFAAGKFLVTRAQYEVFVKATGRKSGGCNVWTGSKWENDSAKDWRNSGFAQDDRHPVVCASWDDASAYVQWLSQKTGKSYRLLSEAEWEYAARAGTTAYSYWGEDGNLSCGFANGADQSTKTEVPRYSDLAFASCYDGYAYTAPVGSFQPNRFGLYDMLGNVWQWTQDCSNPNYSGAPTDGSAWVGGDCSHRALRGGSWISGPPYLSTAFRNLDPTASRYFYQGFRVARTE